MSQNKQISQCMFSIFCNIMCKNVLSRPTSYTIFLHTILRNKDIAIKRQRDIFSNILSIDICGTYLSKNNYFQFTRWKKYRLKNIFLSQYLCNFLSFYLNIFATLYLFIFLSQYLCNFLSFYPNILCKNIVWGVGIFFSSLIFETRYSLKDRNVSFVNFHPEVDPIKLNFLL